MNRIIILLLLIVTLVGGIIDERDLEWKSSVSIGINRSQIYLHKPTNNLYYVKNSKTVIQNYIGSKILMFLSKHPTIVQNNTNQIIVPKIELVRAKKKYLIAALAIDNFQDKKTFWPNNTNIITGLDFWLGAILFLDIGDLSGRNIGTVNINNKHVFVDVDLDTIFKDHDNIAAEPEFDTLLDKVTSRIGLVDYQTENVKKQLQLFSEINVSDILLIVRASILELRALGYVDEHDLTVYSSLGNYFSRKQLLVRKYLEQGN